VYVLGNEQTGAVTCHNNKAIQGLLASTSIKVLKNQMEREIEIEVASHAW
jgi:hypothetical protein